MAKLEVSVVEFKAPGVTIGGRNWENWSRTAPAHDPYSGCTTVREVRDERGVTLALFFTYKAGKVEQEIEVPAGDIRSICRIPAVEPEAEKPAAKAGAK